VIDEIDSEGYGNQGPFVIDLVTRKVPPEVDARKPAASR
jgi:hypothetical protein